MRITRFTGALSVLATVLATAFAAPAAHAETFPARPIRIVVGFPTGGAPDTLARIVSEKISPSWGQPVVVDNKPGAGGNIGAEAVARAPGDGYTLALGTVGTHSINGAVYSKLPYDMVKDFAPVILLATTPNVLVVHPGVPARTTAELIALAKAKPGALTFGTPGIGTSPHVAGELFNTVAGVKITHVPYKGRAMAIPDLLGGHITMMFDNLPSALPVIKEGKLRALGVTSLKRSASAPDIPTLAEQGLNGFQADSWFAIFVPATTPKDVIAKLNTELNRIFTLPDVQAKLKTLGLDPVLGTPDALASFQKAEIAKWAKVVKDSGTTPQ
ncbi:extra-cytoplasmic solute receptor [Cupriavidus gilardii CR3]|uniref:Tripartite tricarboxylate transporter substrate binding protein n=1 Tax=Cupriavidus gilardii TaxID=82541 RepID=A0A849B3Y8_9BURK|nr:tripartite tricarboxylate transporter substrate binding protein [Cupriavidus gilardii]ALD92350.1 extra-cytoplasmic solute receptor [Cupriavidus gilardii CR3]KAB0594315.1 tripartite tricarboxylate transporter substrate binding protein [Cupriavidus gilardii]MCT9014708.1 tripartite tricarboxylate transporter substrate binding protein [Cupriavidus gilardii]MCT9053120.1 tripartite tricarboxylate transporter substrate binding protein [Cupriavidus gilardii]NNH09872.1 tripartite tricarboxylate tran